MTTATRISIVTLISMGALVGILWATRALSPQDLPAAPGPIVPAQVSPTAAKSLRIPPEFDGFASWPFGRQLDAVTDIQRNPHLSPAMRDFLVDLASDASRRPVLRNNAANALGIQDPPVAGWLGKLAEQALDPAENTTWRDYALQHLSDQLVSRNAAGDFMGGPDSGLDRRRYLDVLTTVASGTQLVTGTALLHLDRLSREHGVDIDQARFHALILQAIDGPEVDVGVKVTAFGILGMRKDPADAVIARRFLQDHRADMRRVAVAALGQLGTKADIVAIEAVSSNGDSSVEMAKEGAIKRLRAARVTP